MFRMVYLICKLMQKRSIDIRWSLAKRCREQFEQRESPDDYLRSGSEKL